MLQRPVLRPEFVVEMVEPEGVLLVSEHTRAILPGTLYQRLVAVLDGSRTTDTIVAVLADTHAAAHVYLALSRLEARGYLVEADAATGLPREEAAFWSALGVGGAAATIQAAPTVALELFSTVDDGPLRAALAGMRLRVETSASAALTVAVIDDPLHVGVAEFNTAALTSGRPWLLLKPSGAVPWIGPLFRPGVSACWECLAHRLRLNRSAEAFLHDRRNGGTTPAPAAVPASLGAVFALAAVEVGKVLGGAGALEGVLTTLDLRSLETARHTVTRRPQCPRCGNPQHSSTHAPRPITLERRPKQHTMDGGYRTATPEQTLARYGHHVSPLTGVVPRLQRVPLDEGGRLHAYTAGLNPAMATHSLHALGSGLRDSSGGKGMSREQARASALGEALERYSGRVHGDEPRVRVSFRELGARAVHPNACMLYSEAQYRDRDRWNARSRYTYVPELFDETAVIDWTPVWSLTRGEQRYVPASFCWYAYPGPGAAYCRGDSNGCAAGNTREEAILQGFFELAERDAVAVWWYNRLQQPAVDLDSFGSVQITELQQAYRGLGREVWALDLTHDLGIPTFAACSRRTDGAGEVITFGFGAHADARVALSRALTEMGQFVAASDRVGERAALAAHDPDAARWLATATLANQPYLAPAASPPRRLSDYELPAGSDLRDDVLRCQAIVERQGMELLMLDQTRPDIGLPVVKVIVPGLRHFWARYAPGRLFDVPVQLGRLERPLSEAELNPIPMFF